MIREYRIKAHRGPSFTVIEAKSREVVFSEFGILRTDQWCRMKDLESDFVNEAKFTIKFLMSLIALAELSFAELMIFTDQRPRKSEKFSFWSDRAGNLARPSSMVKMGGFLECLHVTVFSTHFNKNHLASPFYSD